MGCAQEGDLTWFGAILRPDSRGNRSRSGEARTRGGSCGGGERGLVAGTEWEWRCEKLEPQDVLMDWR